MLQPQKHYTNGTTCLGPERKFIVLLRRINVRIKILLDDMLVMAQLLKEISQAKKTLIFLLQNLGFVINLKRFATNTSEGNKILGDSDKSLNMKLALP